MLLLFNPKLTPGSVHPVAPEGLAAPDRVPIRAPGRAGNDPAPNTGADAQNGSSFFLLLSVLYFKPPAALIQQTLKRNST